MIIWPAIIRRHPTVQLRTEKQNSDHEIYSFLNLFVTNHLPKTYISNTECVPGQVDAKHRQIADAGESSRNISQDQIYLQKNCLKFGEYLIFKANFSCMSSVKLMKVVSTPHTHESLTSSSFIIRSAGSHRLELCKRAIVHPNLTAPLLSTPTLQLPKQQPTRA